MNDFLSSILPRIRQFSTSLNEKERFVEKPWGMIDFEGNRCQYIFLRNGRLLRSINGIVTEGKWEYLPSVNSLIIEIDFKKVMMKHLFFDEHALVLSIDDFSDRFLFLANENLIPELNVQKYLKQLTRSNKSYSIELRDGSTLDLVGQEDNILRVGSFVSQNNMPLNGTFITKSNLHLIVKKGFVKTILYRKFIYTLSCEFEIVSRDRDSIQVGDAVMDGNSFLYDGAYRISKNQLIQVKEGVIEDIKEQKVNLRRLNSDQRDDVLIYEDTNKESGESSGGIKPEYLVAFVVFILIIFLIKLTS